MLRRSAPRHLAAIRRIGGTDLRKRRYSDRPGV